MYYLIASSSKKKSEINTTENIIISSFNLVHIIFIFDKLITRNEIFQSQA